MLALTVQVAAGSLGSLREDVAAACGASLGPERNGGPTTALPSWCAWSGGEYVPVGQSYAGSGFYNTTYPLLPILPLWSLYYPSPSIPVLAGMPRNAYPRYIGDEAIKEGCV